MSCYTPSKIVVFDLDETLGSFSQLGALWDSVRLLYQTEPSNEHFFRILDLFPSFLRPNILHILKSLVEAREKGKCLSIIMYTNNNGPKKWAQIISKYFDYKLNAKVFDLIIPAYKAHGRIVEKNRTSHDKNYDDLMRCTNLPDDTLVCFIDDQYHSLSIDPRVLYIPVDPYVHKPDVINVASIYYDDAMPSQTFDSVCSHFINNLGKSWRKKGTTIKQCIPSHKRLVYGLKTFLNHPLNYTRKKNTRKSRNKTKKKRKKSRRKY